MAPPRPFLLALALAFFTGALVQPAQAVPSACADGMTCAAAGAGYSCYATPAGSWKYPFTCALSSLTFYACPANYATAQCANSASFCSPTAARCACSDSFTGAFCELPLTTCDEGLHCANNATCGATFCTCPAGWIDTNCELAMLSPAVAVASPPSGVNIPGWSAVLIVIGVIVLVGSCAALCFLIMRERRGKPVFVRLEQEYPPMTRGQELHVVSLDMESRT